MSSNLSHPSVESVLSTLGETFPNGNIEELDSKKVEEIQEDANALMNKLQSLKSLGGPFLKIEVSPFLERTVTYSK